MGDVAILGAGAGGCAAAAVLPRHGLEVTLFSRAPERLEAIRDRGGLEITGDRGGGVVPLPHLPPDIADAGRAAFLLIFTVANAHAALSRLLAPRVRVDHVVLLASGSAGSLEVARIWREGGLTRLPPLGETAPLPQSAPPVGPPPGQDPV